MWSALAVLPDWVLRGLGIAEKVNDAVAQKAAAKAAAKAAEEGKVQDEQSRRDREDLLG